MKINLSPLYSFTPTSKEEKEIEGLVEDFLRLEKVEDTFEYYADHQATETEADVPSLVITDFSEIPFLDGFLGIQFYQYRMRILADSHDIMAGTFPLDPFLEKYDQKFLDMGHPDYIPIQERKYRNFLFPKKLSNHPDSFEQLVKAIKQKDIEHIHPYMGVRDVWELCLDLSKATGRKLKVLGPLPVICRWVNDKSYFSQFVKQVLGESHIVNTKWAGHLEHICEGLKELAEGHPKVALKIANYASALGNIIYDQKDLKHDFKKKVGADLKQHGWRDGSTVCMVEWRSDVLSSPSCQMWIPALNEGYPIVEGVFEQFLEGPTKIFQGSRPSQLPENINQEVANMSFLLSRFFQKLGYVGRCSFDLIVSGKSLENSEIQFVECNGRWGGTSLPMSFMNRMFGDHRSVSYKAIDIIHPKLKGTPFKKFLSIFKNGEIYDATKKTGHFIFYNTACMEPTSKFDVIALGKNLNEAQSRMDHELPQLIDYGL